MISIISSTFFCSVLPVETRKCWDTKILDSANRTPHERLTSISADLSLYYFPFQSFLINWFFTGGWLLYRILLVSVKPQHESIPGFHGLPSCLQFTPSHFHPPSGHLSISGKCLLPLVLDSTHNLPGRPPHLSNQTLSEISLWISFTKSRERLCSLESFDPQRSDEQEERTDRHQAPGQEEVLKSRRERSQAAHLVADGLVLEPRLVQDLLQLLVVEVGHPDGLGQPCILTLLKGLGGRDGEQSLGMGKRTIIKAERESVKSVTQQELALIIKKEWGEEWHVTKRIAISSLEKPGEHISHGRK